MARPGTLVEVVVLLTGWLLGGTVGLGTALFALLIGGAVALGLAIAGAVGGASGAPGTPDEDFPELDA